MVARIFVGMMTSIDTTYALRGFPMQDVSASWDANLQVASFIFEEQNSFNWILLV